MYASKVSPNVHLFLHSKNSGAPGFAQTHSPCRPRSSILSQSLNIIQIPLLKVTLISCPNNFSRQSGINSDSFPTVSWITSFIQTRFLLNFDCLVQHSSISRQSINTLFMSPWIVPSMNQNYVKGLVVFILNISRNLTSKLCWLRPGPLWICN